MQERFYSYYYKQQSTELYPAPVVYIPPMDLFYGKYYEFEPRTNGDVMFMKYDNKKFGPNELTKLRHATDSQKQLIINFVQFLDHLRKILGPDIGGKLWMFKNRYIGRYANSDYANSDSLQIEMEIKAIIVVLGIDNFLQDFF